MQFECPCPLLAGVSRQVCVVVSRLIEEDLVCAMLLLVCVCVCVCVCVYFLHGRCYAVSGSDKALTYSSKRNSTAREESLPLFMSACNVSSRDVLDIYITCWTMSSVSLDSAIAAAVSASCSCASSTAWTVGMVAEVSACMLARQSMSSPARQSMSTFVPGKQAR